MTPQSIIRIQFTEINSIELVCQRCGGAMVVPIRDSFPEYAQCPGCNQQWFEAHHADVIYQAVSRLAGALAKWKQLSEQEKRLRLQFSLEVPVK